jgi:hypothetical protein
MEISEVLGDVLALAEEEDNLEPNDTLKKQWIKSIHGLNKSFLDGYSLVGDFVAESEQLEAGLYLIYQEFTRSWVVEKSCVKWEGMASKKRMAEDGNGNIIFEKRKVEESCTVRRGVLFDFSDRVSLIYCRFLPQRWAKRLWKPIEAWLEQQPNIGAKIEFWKKEVELRAYALSQAQSRLEALKRHTVTQQSEEEDRQLNEWLKTAAILGSKKATGERSLEG